MKRFLLLFFLTSFYIFFAEAQVVHLENWKFRHGPDTNWYQVKVPGTAHTDIVRTGIISDPFYGDNEKSVQWIENEEWVYRCDFVLTASQCQTNTINLVMKGLDTYADIRLNDKALLTANNMFREWSLGVKKYLVPGKNRLEVHFFPVVKEMSKQTRGSSSAPAGYHPQNIRKASYHFGWAGGPRLVTCGIWQPVYLKFIQQAEIAHLQATPTLVNRDSAYVDFNISIYSIKKTGVTLRITSADEPGLRLEKTLQISKGENPYQARLGLVNPRLWWPNGLGEAHLYPFKVELCQGKETLSTATVNVGFRTVSLAEGQDSTPSSLHFLVNGVPVFLKGAVYIPPDCFLPRTDSAIYDSLLLDAKASNCNVLRVWGGGVYPNDLFFDLCDRYGLLVWQDLMFTGGPLPSDKAFLDQAKEEITDNIIRIRNHPSLLLWSGNGDAGEALMTGIIMKDSLQSAADSISQVKNQDALFRELIPSLIEELDPGRPYLLSGNGSLNPDKSPAGSVQQKWETWLPTGEKGKYTTKGVTSIASFMFQGLPDINTIDGFIERADNYLGSGVMNTHQKNAGGYEALQKEMSIEYHLPKTLPEYVYVSQCYQAENARQNIEMFRRDKQQGAGILYWQFNDCWPGITASGRDWQGRWKSMQYAVKKAFDPILVSMVKEASDDISICLINDSGRKMEGGQMEIKMFTFNGNMLFMRAFRNIEIEDSKNTIITLAKQDYAKQLEVFGRDHCVLHARFWDDRGYEHFNDYYFLSPRQLKLTHNVSIDIRQNGKDRYTIVLTGHSLVKNLHLYLDQGDAWFSDNNFDLVPEEKKEVQCRCSLSLEKMMRSLKTMSLGNIY